MSTTSTLSKVFWIAIGLLSAVGFAACVLFVIGLGYVGSQAPQREYIDKDMTAEYEDWEVKGRYSYLRGHVKNVGRRVVTYWRVVVRYKDASGAVLDTAYTNSAETLRPGESKKFEIMHHADERFKKVNIVIEDVRLGAYVGRP